MGSDSGTNNRNDIFLGGQSPPPKPKGLLDAISEIQQYYVVERSGSTIPKDFFTITGRMAFFEVGFKGGLISGLVSTLLSPLAIGVFEQYIPIFGDTNPTFFDTFFAFFLTVSYTLGYAMFYGSLGKYYVGALTRAAIKNLLVGLASGAGLKMVIAFLGFHYLYSKLLEPSWLERLLQRLYGIVSYDVLNGFYVWLMEFRPVFLIASYLVVFSTILMVGIPLSAITVRHYQIKKEMEAEQKWQ